MRSVEIASPSSPEVAYSSPGAPKPAPISSDTIETASQSRQADGEYSAAPTVVLANAVLPTHVSQPIVPTAPSTRIADTDRGRQVLLRNIQLLEEGNRLFRKFPHYSANFIRQERIDGELCPVEEIDLKVRHAPFSVYMQWLSVDVGRELLYVDGTNEGRMLVRLGGWKGRMLPTLNIDPQGPDARERSRYPISQAGILALADILLENRRNDLARNVNIRCDYSENRMQNGRNCHYFCFEFETPSESEVYRKSVQYIDSDWLIPICVQNYTWPDTEVVENATSLDDDTLIEYYSYSEINTELRLSDADFDRGNPDYRFR